MMANQDSPEAVESLVQRLYQLGPGIDLQSTQQQLQDLQRSPQGWQLGDYLLRSPEQNIRFFGALTFTVKIKRDWDTLSGEDAVSLLERLLYHIVHLVNSGESALVVRKLCTALIAYYLQPSTSWQRCIAHLMACLSQGEVIPFNSFIESGVTVPQLLERLNESQLLASLWLAAGLAEEGKQGLVATTESTQRHKIIVSNIDDIVSLLEFTLNHPLEDSRATKRAQESIKCFQAWVMYTQRAWVDKAIELGSMRSLVPSAIQALNQEQLFEEATEMLSDILRNFATFFTPRDYDSLATVLAGPQAQSLMAELKEGDFNPLATAFGVLLLAYGDANVQDLARRDDPKLQQILQQLLDLLGCDGYAGVDDEICTPALDFWTTYVEFVTDSLFTVDPLNKPVWMERAQGQVVRVIEAAWGKIQYPPGDVAARWDSSARAAFQAFRSDVQDILQTSYTLLGLSIFEKFAWLTLKSLEDQAWLHLEATLFCINALSEAVADEDAVDDILSKIFGSSLFPDMISQNDSIPAKTRQIAVSMITKYISFFERHLDHLPAMLRFLFESVKAPAMTSVAAKAISTACSSCRKDLTSELHAFLDQYESISSLNSFDFYSKEKVIGGIAAIVQALPSDEEKIGPLSRLAQFVQRDLETCIRLMNQSEPDMFQTYGIGALKCLVSMGKSLQTPDEVAIDLDGDPAPSQLWATGQGHSLQMIVVDILRKITNLMSWNSEVMEAGCQLLRVGHKESQMGLFVFPTQVTVDFVQATTLNTSRLDLVIDTASALLSRQAQALKHENQLAATYFLNHSIELLELLNYNPSAEPEVCSSIIDLADKMIPRYVLSMNEHPNISRFLDFTLRSLASPEILPKRSASHFWATFINKHNIPNPSPSADFIAAIVARYGLQVTRIIIHGIAGEAPRSALDTLGEPLKKLIFAQPRAKEWLTQALYADDFPSAKVGGDVKRVWLQKIMTLRGARKTNNEVRDFWIACRGSESAFAF